MLVLVFCVLVSASEYYPGENQEAQTIEQYGSGDHSDESDENQTYLDVDVDAVVPFAVGLTQQVFHLIYENISTAPPVLSGYSGSTPLNFPFWEILFERIIAPNAP